jgi:hypothetical protein
MRDVAAFMAIGTTGSCQRARKSNHVIVTRCLSHQTRLAYLQSTAFQLKTHSSAANSHIGSVTLDSFTDESELEAKVKQYVDSAIEQSLKHGGTVSP